MLVMTANMHRGEGVGLGWFAQVRELKPAVVLGQEVNGGAFARMQGALGRDYLIAPGMAFRIGGREPEATPVLMRKSLFRFVAQGNPLVSPWKGGGDHGVAWPSRWGTWMLAQHKRSGVMVRATSRHTWALFPGSPPDVHDGHAHQLAALRAWSDQAGPYAIAGGDFNDNPLRIATGLKLAASNDVDAIYQRGFTVLGQSVVANATGSDHRMVVARLKLNR